MDDSEEGNIKIACQTILWGSRLDDPLDMFQTIYELGFQGVEICQPPSSLPVPSALRAIFEHLNLTFLGFYGGTLPARINYCQKYCHPTFGLKSGKSLTCASMTGMKNLAEWH